MAVANSSYTALLTTTLAEHRAALADNITANIALVFWLREKGRLKMEDGGHKLVEPLMYGKGNTQAYSGYEELDVTPVEGISAAEYNFKQLATPITIDETTLKKNKGKNRILSLLEAREEQAMITMEDDLNYQLFQDGLGSGGKDFLGLQAIVADAPTTGTLGGINRATYSFWRNQTYDGTPSATAFDDLLNEMRNCYLGVKRRKQKPDIIITTPTIYGGYEGLNVDKMRYASNKLVDAGFNTQEYKNIPMIDDDDCPSGKMYMLNTTYLKMRIHRELNFEVTPFEMPVKQRALVAFILLMGNLTCSNCARQGVIHTIS